MNYQIVNLAEKLIKEWGFIPSLRVSVTNQCNLHCSFCHNEGNAHGDVYNYLTTEKIEEIAHLFHHIGVYRVKITGGEPTLREDLEGVIGLFRKHGYEEVSLVSNGVRLNPERQIRLRKSGLDRVNVSLNSLDPGVYSKIYGVREDFLQITINNLKNISDIFPSGVKINTVFIPGLNYPMEVVPLAEFCRSIRATLSVLSLLKEQEVLLSDEISNLLMGKFEVDSKLTQIKRMGETTTIYFVNGFVIELDDFRQKKALYNKNSNDYCRECSVRQLCVEGPYAFRIKADGTFKPCLLRQDNEIKLY